MEEEAKGLEEPEATDGYSNTVFSESSKAVAHTNTWWVLYKTKPDEIPAWRRSGSSTLS